MDPSVYEAAKAFFAYPSGSAEVLNAISALSKLSKASSKMPRIVPWHEVDVTGRLINKEILLQIDQADYFLADISVLNSNVTYELAYAIGRKKPVANFINKHLEGPETKRLRDEVGIFDTIGYRLYENGNDLASYIQRELRQIPPLHLPRFAGTASAIYYVDAPSNTDLVAVARHKLRNLFGSSCSIFDPTEKSRLPPAEAISHVEGAAVVVATLLPVAWASSLTHNIRSAFVCGLAHALNKHLVILQLGEDAPPLDFRDDVTVAGTEEKIEKTLYALVPRVMAHIRATDNSTRSRPSSFLESLNFGQSVAEDEETDLPSYYYETDAFHRAMRGEARVVLGRKGSGKTALFYQLAYIKKSARQERNLVLDLQPETYKLVRFKEEVLRLFQPGTRLHVVTAMWNYILLLEIAYRLLDEDKSLYQRDHRIFLLYTSLNDVYARSDVDWEGDFSQRLALLLESISSEVVSYRGGDGEAISISSNEVTAVIHKHPIAELQARVVEYLKNRGEVWILIDHLDRGWPSTGIREEDIHLVQGLLEAAQKLRRSFSRSGISCYPVVFLRSDVFEWMVENTQDSGKISKVSVDWSDREAMQMMLQQRLVFSGLPETAPFGVLWASICSGVVAAMPSNEYLLSRCLMRPRALLGNLAACRNRAVNRRHDKIEESDVIDGTRDFSQDLLRDVIQEIQDVAPELENALYAFIDTPASFSLISLHDLFRQYGIGEGNWDVLIEHFLWYGVLGVEGIAGKPTYIYDINYDLNMLKAIARKTADRTVYWINPAFRPALSVSEP